MNTPPPEPPPARPLGGPNGTAPVVPPPGIAPRRYGRLLRRVVASTAGVALLPLVITAAINYYQFRSAMRAEARGPIVRLTASYARTVQIFLRERESALRLIVHSGLVQADCSDAQLRKVLWQARKSISMGAFVDLGVISPSGRQTCYAGPYRLKGKDYSDQTWFHEVQRRGLHVSHVFLGYRRSPHFVIAIRRDGPEGVSYILRATVDAAQLGERLLRSGLAPGFDAFLVNPQGIIQTQSRRYGPELSRLPFPVPPATETPEVSERQERGDERVLVGAARVPDTDFVVLLVAPQQELLGQWFTLRAELLGFLLLSSVLVFLVILWSARKLVRSLKAADRARAEVYHRMEYTNKLASLGRMAAGIAHEINNPLAIINERAGLIQDLLDRNPDIPQADRLRKSTDSILKSVERCSRITHRLLGFAKHMDVRVETLSLRELLEEVLGFLEKEAAYRSIEIVWDVDPDVPNIQSDRGQLQQVFLNLINNAFAAMQDGGRLRLAIRQAGPGRVAVEVEDNGSGIPEEHLDRIFEPFFTTKGTAGTGLGLSVTYGIVQKLGGDIRVQSTVGEGTRFTVELPVYRA